MKSHKRQLIVHWFREPWESKLEPKLNADALWLIVWFWPTLAVWISNFSSLSVRWLKDECAFGGKALLAHISLLGPEVPLRSYMYWCMHTCTCNMAQGHIGHSLNTHHRKEKEDYAKAGTCIRARPYIITTAQFKRRWNLESTTSGTGIKNL